MQKQTSFSQSTSNDSLGKLYLVPTPIGNLEDMTFRAVNVLKAVDVILAEDTRQTIKLLNHFEISVPLRSYHEHSSSKEVDHWVEQLRTGHDIALVSDAGMPLINDPGHPLVSSALAQNLSVIALPGANAALTALVASGLPTEQFTYYGFFPRGQKEQNALLQQIGQRSETAIFYESPFRVKDSIKQIGKQLGQQTPIVLARELTKRFEEYLRGNVEELSEYLRQNDLKGECVLLIQGGQLAAENQTELEKLSYKDHVNLLMAQQGLTAKEAIKEVAKIQQVKKQLVYNAYHEIT